MDRGLDPSRPPALRACGLRAAQGSFATRELDGKPAPRAVDSRPLPPGAILRPMLAAVLLSLCVLVAPDDTAAARGKNGLTVTREALEALLLDRYGHAESGRDLLDLFLKARLLETMATREGIAVSQADVTRRWEELDKHSKAAGQTLADEIQRRNLTAGQFREFLRLALVQERLTRSALGLPKNAEVSGAQQEIWLQQEMGTRGLEVLPPSPGVEGLMARCGEITVTRAEFARFLFERLGREDVRESAWHLLLLQAIEKRMPDLAPEARQQALQEELERRRRKHEAEYPTITYEQRLGATGRTLEGMRSDPSVAIAALSRLWVDRTAGPEGIRTTYEKERDLFEARYGEALRTALLFRVAGRFVNDLCPRTFEQAEEELRKLAAKIRNQADFTQHVARYSEEPGTKKQQGDLGWVTRGDARVPAELREALFQAVETGGTIPEGGRLVGPVRLGSGCGLLWVSALRPSPSWEEMSERVHEELRRRFLEELMPKESVELLAPHE